VFSKKTLPACALALLLLVSMLVLTSCASRPSVPEQSLPLDWPILPLPPDGISLDATETIVLVPLDYWVEMVAYIRSVEDIRAQLEREGRLVKDKE